MTPYVFEVVKNGLLGNLCCNNNNFIEIESTLVHVILQYTCIVDHYNNKQWKHTMIIC